jgi:hypothetical protein
MRLSLSAVLEAWQHVVTVVHARQGLQTWIDPSRVFGIVNTRTSLLCMFVAAVCSWHPCSSSSRMARHWPGAPVWEASPTLLPPPSPPLPLLHLGWSPGPLVARRGQGVRGAGNTLWLVALPLLGVATAVAQGAARLLLAGQQPQGAVVLQLGCRGWEGGAGGRAASSAWRRHPPPACLTCLHKSRPLQVGAAGCPFWLCNQAGINHFLCSADDTTWLPGV